MAKKAWEEAEEFAMPDFDELTNESQESKVTRESRRRGIATLVTSLAIFAGIFGFDAVDEWFDAKEAARAVEIYRYASEQAQNRDSWRDNIEPSYEPSDRSEDESDDDPCENLAELIADGLIEKLQQRAEKDALCEMSAREIREMVEALEREAKRQL